MRTYIAISLHLSNNNKNKSSLVPYTHTHTKGDRNKYSSTPFFLFLFFDQLLLNTFYNKTYRILLPKKTPKDLKKNERILKSDAFSFLSLLGECACKLMPPSCLNFRLCMSTGKECNNLLVDYIPSPISICHQPPRHHDDLTSMYRKCLGGIH